MRKWRTDLTAVACILGGGVLGGAATVAFLAAQESAPSACTFETASTSPHIVVSRSAEGGTVVLSSPHVRVHSVEDCTARVRSDVTIHLEDLRSDMEAARVELKELQMQDQVHQMRQMMMELRAVEGEAAEAEARLNEVQVILEKVEGGRGGRI
jgi:hypothetical protein